MGGLQKIIEYLFYLFIFLLPWQTRWIWHPGNLGGGFWEYGSFSLYGTEILLWLILILFFVWQIKKLKACPERSRGVKSSKLIVILPVYFLLLIVILSIFWAKDSGLALFTFFRFLEVVALFFFVLNFEFSFLKMAVSWMSAAAIQGALAFWQFSSQLVWPSKWLGLALHRPDILGDFVIETINGRWLRAYGSLPHPNILAGFLVISFFLALFLWLKANLKNQKIWVLFCAFLILTGLFLTFSRVTLLTVIIIILLYCLIVLINKKFRKNLKSLFPILIFSILLIAFLMAIFYQPFVTRLKGEQRLEIKSYQERILYIQQAKKLIKNNWFLGVGAGNYTLAVYKQINSNLNYWQYQPVHNIYLLVLAELGIFGFLFFLFLIFYCFVLSLSKGLSPAWKKILKNDILIPFPFILLVILIIGLFDHYFWTLYFGVIIFWLILGMSFKYSQSLTKNFDLV